MNAEFDFFLQEHEIVSQLTPPVTSQLNGVTECRNRTLINMVHSTLSYNKLAHSLWGHVLLIAAHILNRCPSMSVLKSPQEMRGRRPSFKYIKIWGCPAYVKRIEVENLEARSIKGCFIHYPDDLMRCLLYLHNDQLIIIALQSYFLEDKFIQEDRAGRMIILKEQNKAPKEPTIQEQQAKLIVTQPLL